LRSYSQCTSHLRTSYVCERWVFCSKKMNTKKFYHNKIFGIRWGFYALFRIFSECSHKCAKFHFPAWNDMRAFPFSLTMAADIYYSFISLSDVKLNCEKCLWEIFDPTRTQIHTQTLRESKWNSKILAFIILHKYTLSDDANSFMR
jgi:hypothetical protein